MKAEFILEHCISNNIRVDASAYMNAITDAFDVYGFGESRYVTIYDGNDGVYCKDRFDRINKIESFDDLIYIAYEWNKKELNKGYNCDDKWLPIFLKHKMVEIKKIEKTIVIPLI